ncbi:MAG: hypothetical protein HZA50_00150 [Planctomycetes bacterium]|nr:hypothetical protein [Planctomycetota bacterium]
MKTLIAALLFVAAGAVGGCTPPDPNADLSSQAVSPIADVPLPLSFEMDESQSKNLTEPGSGFRTVDHLFKGKDDKNAVAKFYRNRMKDTRWTNTLDRFDGGTWSLQFQKEKEQCDIRIFEKGLFPKTYIAIKLSPVGKPVDGGDKR